MPHAHLLCVGGVHDTHEAVKRQLLPQVLQQAVFGLRPEVHVGIVRQQRDECRERLLGLEVLVRLAVRKCLASHQPACQPARVATPRAKSEVSVAVCFSTRTPKHGGCRYTTQTAGGMCPHRRPELGPCSPASEGGGGWRRGRETSLPGARSYAQPRAYACSRTCLRIRRANAPAGRAPRWRRTNRGCQRSRRDAGCWSTDTPWTSIHVNSVANPVARAHRTIHATHFNRQLARKRRRCVSRAEA